ncbi:MAG: Uncharacterised protein [Flavobacterium sp. SCGC AAA160-P02]|nr:MAG: Uncharacterised protein [Flavobacterium sp. SCGC AAA160-P02]
MFYKVTSEVFIKSTSEKVWKLISTPKYLEKVHPFCKKNTILEIKDNKIKKDLLVYNNGLKYIRIFKNWKNEIGYDLLVGREKGKKSYVKWIINPNNEGAKLKISIIPYTSDKIYSIFRPFVFYFIIRPSLKKYLFSVLNGIKWVAENDTNVQKNQFGKHPWFT